ncbi:mannose/fructose/sorbose PTS transporter subunit IIA [Oenococcus alcoholitolerans]|uniref:PTS system mannose-specific EIIAB component n=1 Tax=Oenococcus alcoholitolerans TaxID=931074 RepID=A0ABR4XTB4_9LACO|nr:PTS mannose transporter subunit IIAB [Oenococcus alcoholitolerans]
MVGIVIASHGDFAKGIKQSGSMIFGEQKNVEAVSFMPNEGPEDLRKHLEDAIASFDEDSRKEVLFLIDLWGGSPFNQSNAIFEEHQDTMAIVTGLNLPMLIEAYASRLTAKTSHEIAAHILGEAKAGVRIKPESLTPKNNSNNTNENSEQPAPKPAPAPVKVDPSAFKDRNSFEIGLARLDSRLLHGQVATAWAKSIKPTRIIVVSDAVAHNDLRKSLITEAAPSGIKANVIPINKLIEIAKDSRFVGQRFLLLFETPQDVVKAVDGGVKIPELNIGSMAHSEGKTMINNVLSVDENDVEALKHLSDNGVKFDVRKVPADSDKDLFALIIKAGLNV